MHPVCKKIRLYLIVSLLAEKKGEANMLPETVIQKHKKTTELLKFHLLTLLSSKWPRFAHGYSVKYYIAICYSQNFAAPHSSNI